jgi:hypothetical protein
MPKLMSGVVVVCVLLNAIALRADEPPKKPPYQRLLQGEDARKAQQLKEQIVKHWEEMEFEKALKAAEELAQRRLLSAEEVSRRSQLLVQLERLDRQIEQALATPQVMERSQVVERSPDRSTVARSGDRATTERDRATAEERKQRHEELLGQRLKVQQEEVEERLAALPESARGLKLEPVADGRQPAADDRPFEHPFYWSAFILIGDPE